FDETRNYVQRVLEGRNMYQRRLGANGVTTVWFRPVNGPLEPAPVAALKPLDEVERIMIAELEARAPRPRLKPDVAAEPPTVIPAEYQSQSQVPPVPESTLRLVAQSPLPEPKPEGALHLAAESPLPELKPEGALRLAAERPVPEPKPTPES
ncbi:MAG: hypothetical protein ACREIR_06070, partial [Geminicoccaceae bacterium]